jgi:Rod binding domain-containing protein
MDNLISLSPDLLAQRAEVKRPSVEDAAREFETMLIAQWLKSARDAGSVLAEPSDMAGADNYMEMAEKTLEATARCSTMWPTCTAAVWVIRISTTM